MPVRRPNLPDGSSSVKGLEPAGLVGQNRPVGFNPFRQQRRRSTDYLMVAAAFVVVAALLLWAMIPR